MSKPIIPVNGREAGALSRAVELSSYGSRRKRRATHSITSLSPRLCHDRWMADTIITVQGEYELRHPAERGAVRLRVSYEGPSRDEVLALTTQRQLSLSSELRELHNPLSGPVTQWSSDQLRVWGDRPWTGDGR